MSLAWAIVALVAFAGHSNVIFLGLVYFEMPIDRETKLKKESL